MKKCRICKKVKSIDNYYSHPATKDKLFSLCKECHKKKLEIWRIENAEKNKAYKVTYRKRNLKKLTLQTKNWKKNNPLKAKAHEIIHSQTRIGKLKRGYCIICKNKKTEGHHPNYNKPLKVVWLCKKHHSEEHNKH